MSLSRRNPRRDSNEKAIRAALERAGADVTPVSGRGSPDVLVRFRGKLWAFEIKTAKGKQTEAQKETAWPIVKTPEEALQAIGATR